MFTRKQQTYEHTSVVFTHARLETSRQNDSCNCGVFAINTLNHWCLPEKFPLLATSQGPEECTRMFVNVVNCHLDQSFDVISNGFEFEFLSHVMQSLMVEEGEDSDVEMLVSHAGRDGSDSWSKVSSFCSSVSSETSVKGPDLSTAGSDFGEYPEGDGGTSSTVEPDKHVTEEEENTGQGSEEETVAKTSKTYTSGPGLSFAKTHPQHRASSPSVTSYSSSSSMHSSVSISPHSHLLPPAAGSSGWSVAETTNMTLKAKPKETSAIRRALQAPEDIPKRGLMQLHEKVRTVARHLKRPVLCET
ncbi:hypothetical protein OF83DRAFT_1086728 [Amylostereum chailletii]|nr:hypothetical protein OF83DRAFT_1086728 [Amylostereum chailletii]